MVSDIQTLTPEIVNFITNNTPAMTLSAGGNLGIGTTSASAQLTLEKSFSSGSGLDNGFLSTVTKIFIPIFIH